MISLSQSLTAREHLQIQKGLGLGCEKFSKYLVGLPQFELQTDHKPLVPLIATKDLDQCPIRCQRLLMLLMRFNPQVRHVPGKELVFTDALSRAPLPISTEPESRIEEIADSVDFVQACWPAGEEFLEKVRTNTARDPTLQQVAKDIVNGWPKEHAVPLPMQYHQVQQELSLINGIVTCGCRIVVPMSLQTEVLRKLHESHQGRAKCRERARAAVWWPGIGQDINVTVDACAFCREHRPSQRHELLRPTPLPSRPWES